MEPQQVESSMVQAVGYDEGSQTLEVVFSNGKTYKYFQVPKQIYEQLLVAESKGSYMQDAVIDCYQYRQIRKRSK
ncbi:KTSC domain-containing protein [Brunnivagina elsteri]|uniref:KTSC domain-containing protein n=1 Tax=Brunnivagina elsteri CCALA 953 TaxID=987040 RepID=A0A2A2TET1_9CYAN|nr:KTSC domain-containing protein [Calothrix elsteri]PAX51909.1 KTSC domain-containing protein [Calothrix elsteri CCALA 953]